MNTDSCHHEGMNVNNSHNPIAVFDIAAIEQAINSGFIDVPVIEDFDAFKEWFESFNTNEYPV